MSKKSDFMFKNIKKTESPKMNSLLFKANELRRTRSLFLPSGSGDNPTHRRQRCVLVFPYIIIHVCLHVAHYTVKKLTTLIISYFSRVIFMYKIFINNVYFECVMHICTIMFTMYCVLCTLGATA